MPPKKRMRFTPRKPKSRARKSEILQSGDDSIQPDTNFYEVEDILSNKTEKGTILYQVKWKNWPSSANTFEPEFRLTCDNKLIKFALTLVFPEEYSRQIRDILEDIYNGLRVHATNTLDPLAIIGQTTVQTGTVKFVHKNTVEVKTMYLKYIHKHNQHYLLHALHLPTEQEVDTYYKKYADQLRYRLETFAEHPQVAIVLPLQWELAFYSPPPLSMLLFEPVTEKMLERRHANKHMFPPESNELGFNNTHSFIDPDYFNTATPYEDPRMYRLGPNQEELIEHMERRSDFKVDPRFSVNLKLHQETPRGWILTVAHKVEADTPLMMMTGVIRPNSAAMECLKTDGETVAFSSFLDIPGTGMCLDRRELYDFSKYIPHSCSPTCSVRLVHSGNEIPDLVVYSLTSLDAFNSMSITLDYYKGFTEDVREYFNAKGVTDDKIFSLYEDKVDFVHCQCLSIKCREVLYVDKSLKRAEKTATKSSKLQALDPEFQFHGMKVADPSKCWNIRRCKFHT